MVWALGPGDHQLGQILHSHLKELSYGKWGYPKLTWVVTQGGSHESLGSPAWQNICQAWAKLKSLLIPTDPHNWEEWCSLPLWRPHVHHIETTQVKCTTMAQHHLRATELCTLGDIILPTRQFKEWETLNLNIQDAAGRRDYYNLIANIRRDPHFETIPGFHLLFFADTTHGNQGRVWKFDISQQDVSSSWQRINQSNLLVCTFSSTVGRIQDMERCHSPLDAVLHPVILQLRDGKKTGRCHYGEWSTDWGFLLQYRWMNVIPILNASTEQL